MSKIIKITDEHIEEIRKDFETALQGAKIADGKITYTKTFGTLDRKAKLYFDEIAWEKMQCLIREFDKEVAWHGTAVRGGDPTKDEYIITDILVYPQEVTSATVNTDQKKYETWLMEHEDEVFNNIRMQGHSHVNMSTSPSSVDLTHQEKILDQLEDDMFYIFLIWNKKGEKTIKIYDLAKNVLFDGNDVSVEVVESKLGLKSFIKNAKEMVKDKVYQTQYPTQYQGYQGYTGYSGYTGYRGYNGYDSYGGHGNTYVSQNEPKKEGSKQENKASNTGKRKGKRKDKNKKQDKYTGCNGYVYPDEYYGLNY